MLTLEENKNVIVSNENQNQITSTPFERNNNLETLAVPPNSLSARLINLCMCFRI